MIHDPNHDPNHEPDQAPDQAPMRRALELAGETAALASPNPQVGCVLVSSQGKTIGEGAHEYAHFDHAEIVALKAAKAAGHSTQGATAYVTLEPCSHHGRTGPCADALLAAGIARCVVATIDPNPSVRGQGVARLQAGGVEVVTGVLLAEARALNNAFAFSIINRRPFVTLKAALSVDGRIAPPSSQRSRREPVFLTGPAARSDVQRLRHSSDAILTGIGTALTDDPLLTDRTGLPRRRPLLRVLLDSQLRLPGDAKLLHPVHGDLLIFCAEQAPRNNEARLVDAGAKVIRIAHGPAGLSLAEALQHLEERKILSLLLEAGSAVNRAFLEQDLVDRAILYYAEAELGPEAVSFAGDLISPFRLEQSLQQLEKRTIGQDVRVSGLLHDPWMGRT